MPPKRMKSKITDSAELEEQGSPIASDEDDAPGPGRRDVPAAKRSKLSKGASPEEPQTYENGVVRSVIVENFSAPPQPHSSHARPLSDPPVLRGSRMRC